jgi:hypothetical protein
MEFDMNKLDIGINELKTLMEWLETVEPLKPYVIRLSAEKTGIGTSIRAEIETKEGEGLWKDLTDYSSW